jgi:hypothetical protein
LVDLTLTYTPSAIPSVSSRIILFLEDTTGGSNAIDEPWLSGTNTLTVTPNRRVVHHQIAETSNTSPTVQIYFKAEGAASVTNIFSLDVTFRY